MDIMEKENGILLEKMIKDQKLLLVKYFDKEEGYYIIITKYSLIIPSKKINFKFEE